MIRQKIKPLNAKIFNSRVPVLFHKPLDPFKITACPELGSSYGFRNGSFLGKFEGRLFMALAWVPETVSFIDYDAVLLEVKARLPKSHYVEISVSTVRGNF